MQYKILSCVYAVAVLAVFLVATSGCTAHNNPWMTPSEGEVLADKVKNGRNYYLRYALAEEEARQDGDEEAAGRWQEAKEKARQDLDKYTQDLSQYEARHGRKPANRSTP
jgi:hypothetical protein